MRQHSAHVENPPVPCEAFVLQQIVHALRRSHHPKVAGIKLAPGKVGPPIRLATLKMTEGKWTAAEQDTQEFAQYIEELENHIGKFIRATVEDAAAKPPPAVPPAAV
jgi:hypothetical protein